MELKKITIAEALTVVSEWTAKAAQSRGSSNAPDLEPLRYLLDTRRPSILGVDLELLAHKGQALVGFRLTQSETIGDQKTRYVLPIHFAIMRAFEVIPGIRLRLDGDSHEGDRAKRKVQRREEKLIYPMNIYLPAALAQKLGIKGQSRLDRILFNAPPDARLHPKRTGHHRVFVPSESVLLEYRGEPLQTQETWLRLAKLALTDGQHDGLRGLPTVLQSLFVTAERWHREELDGRLDDDPRWDHAKAG